MEIIEGSSHVESDEGPDENEAIYDLIFNGIEFPTPLEVKPDRSDYRVLIAQDLQDAIGKFLYFKNLP